MKITRIFLYLSVFLIPLYIFRFHFGVFSTNLFEIFVLLSALVLLLEKPKEYKSSSLWIALMILTLILLVPMLLATDLTRALGVAKSWFMVPALFGWLVYRTFDQKNFYKLSIPLFCSLILVSLWAYLQKEGFISELFYQTEGDSFKQYLNGGRYFGPFESPNFLAMFIAPVFFLSLPVLSKINNIILKIFVGIIFLLPIYALYLTGSRGGQIAFGISAFVFIVLAFLPAIKKYASALSVAKIVGLIAVNVAYFYFFLRITFPELISSDKTRQEIYNYSIDLLHKNWLLGIGLGNFQEKIQALSIGNSTFINFGLPYALHPHNLFLAIWLNLGLAGLIAFLYVLWVLLKKLFSASSSVARASISAAVTVILIHGLFDTTYFKNDLSAIFWLIFAGSLALNKENKDEKSI